MVCTEVGVCDAAPEHPVDSGKDGGGNGDNGFAYSTACFEMPEQGSQIRAPDAGFAPGGLSKQGFEPGCTFAELGRVALVRALVMPGAQVRLGEQWSSRREPAHIDANLGDDHGRSERADPGTVVSCAVASRKGPRR